LFEVSKLAMAPARAEDSRSILAQCGCTRCPCLSPDRLRTSLAPTARQPLSAQAQDYQRFYGLDLPAHSWLGGFQAAGFDLVGQAWLPEQPARRCSCCTAITTTWACTGM
jgi:hypothetical protein